MDNSLIGFSGMGLLVIGILLGINVFAVLGGIGLIGIWLIVGFVPATAAVSSIVFSVVNNFEFSVVPMFLLMGFFAIRAGIGQDLFVAASRWLGRLPGGLAIAATVSAASFGAASGSSVGTVTLFTKIALPEMLSRGYDKGLASASIAISGTLAVLIPPSALVVIYGILTNSSIGPLLLGGILPGAVFALLLCLMIWLVAVTRPGLAPVIIDSVTWKEKFWSLRLVGPLLIVVVAIMGGLYNGVFTPTEAGAIGSLVTLLMAIFRQRGLRGLQLSSILRETVQLTAMVFAIIISSLIFSRFLAISGVTNQIGTVLASGDLKSWQVVFIVTLVYLVFGMLMNAPSLLAVTLPVTQPVMMNLGYDPIWFGIYVVILAEIGLVTPPVGLNCFVLKGAAGKLVSLGDIFRGLIPFILASFVMLLILILFPQLVLYLPNNMGH